MTVSRSWRSQTGLLPARPVARTGESFICARRFRVPENDRDRQYSRTWIRRMEEKLIGSTYPWLTGFFLILRIAAASFRP